MKTHSAKYFRLLKKAEHLGLLFSLLAYSVFILAFVWSVQTWSLSYVLFLIPVLLLVAAFIVGNLVETILDGIIGKIFKVYHHKLKKRSQKHSS